ncbi:MAG: ketopantoate reductase family protein, partial [Bryobacteraceae bacterium]
LSQTTALSWAVVRRWLLGSVRRPLGPDHCLPRSTISLDIDWATAQEYLPVLYDRLIPATAPHRTSMSHDLHAGKRTEIDFLNGAVVRLGLRHGVAVPINALITRLIKRIEASDRTLLRLLRLPRPNLISVYLTHVAQEFGKPVARGPASPVGETAAGYRET